MINKASLKISFIFFAITLVAIILLIPKKKPLETEPEETTELIELKQASFTDLKNWENDNLSEILNGFRLSCEKILKNTNKQISNSKIAVSTEDFQRVCLKLIENPITSSKDVKAFIEENFIPYLVTENGNEAGKFTSYYEAAINASKTKSKIYKYPIYGKPNDLIDFNIQDFDPEADSKRFVGRLQGKKLIPYYSRAEIHNKEIDAPIILWGDSLIDIYVMQIQGSALAYLDDGTEVRIGYADNNGHTFKGIGSILLEKGLLKPGHASMDKIKIWLKENGQTAIDNMNENKRFIFHQLLNTSGPVGAQGLPLTAGRSLAVDTKYIPLGSLLWLETTGPDNEPIEKTVIAQDIGSAIKGAVRGDYYWGSGKEEVLEKAGRMNSKGRYFIMLPKSMEIK